MNQSLLRRLNAHWHNPEPFLALGASLAETTELLTAAIIRENRNEAAGLRRVHRRESSKSLDCACSDRYGAALRTSRLNGHAWDPA
jgi:hypothetical protein